MYQIMRMVMFAELEQRKAPKRLLQTKCHIDETARNRNG